MNTHSLKTLPLTGAGPARGAAAAARGVEVVGKTSKNKYTNI